MRNDCAIWSNDEQISLKYFFKWAVCQQNCISSQKKHEMTLSKQYDLCKLSMNIYKLKTEKADLVLWMLHYPQLHPLAVSSFVMWFNVKSWATVHDHMVLHIAHYAFFCLCCSFTRMGSNFPTNASSKTPSWAAWTTDLSLWNLSSDTSVWGTHLRKVISKWLNPISSNVPTLRTHKIRYIQTMWSHNNTDMHSFNQATTLFLISVKRILMGSDNFFSSSNIKPYN